MTDAATAAEVLAGARCGRPAPPSPATSPSAPPVKHSAQVNELRNSATCPSPVLELQLTARAEADRRWLAERLKTRFGGLEDLGGDYPAERFCVTVLRLATKPVPWTTRTEERLVRKWFFGADPGEALAKARAWVEQQRRRA